MNSSFFYNSNKEYKPYIPKLRILALYTKIIRSIKENVVTFISSKTGSGKSTQVPKYLYDYLQEDNNRFCIICTEPRSIACTSISKYIKSKNRYINIDNNVNKYFEIDGPTLLYIKESDLLYLLKVDPYLSLCNILIIDGVHERTMKLDLILYYIKHFTLNKEKRKKDFRLVLMSATFNSDNIFSYLSLADEKNLTFGFIDQNELDENIREDNYDIIYCNSINNYLCYGNTKFNEYNMKKLLKEITKIIRFEVYNNEYIYDRDYNNNNKTILVFLPDYKSIYSLYNILNREYKDHVNLFQFCSALNIREQAEIINELKESKNKCNIIIATTLAETCLTFPNCNIVIDCGLKKNCKYNYEANIFEEVIEYISQDSCIQRSGRCGRGEIRGKCYRLFSEESFNLMDKYRKPDIETGNIDLIILKLFENEKIIKHVKDEIQSKGYLDFLSKIEKEKYELIVNKLIKYNAIEKNENINIEKITSFGTWAMKANLDIELGYYFDKFVEKYPADIEKESVFQLLNVISTTDNYNCELFYSDIDSDKFKLRLIDNDKNTKDLKSVVDLSKKVSEDIIFQGLKKYIKGEEKNDLLYNRPRDLENSNQCLTEKEELKIYFNKINQVSPYYYLFSKLDDIYGAKNFYSKNKIFQLGDWITSLFFINQYKLMKCLHHSYFMNNTHLNSTCTKCEKTKYFFCMVYSLNEKYFTKLKNKIIHIKGILKFNFINDNEFTISKEEESIIAKWNVVYLNLISYKPDIYINENQIIKYINEFKLINFDDIIDKLYEKYKLLYIDIATKYLELTKNDDEMLIQKKKFLNNISEQNIINTNSNEDNKNSNSTNEIIIYFNKDDKANLMKSYFFEFIPKEIDKYFCLTKFRKILGTDQNDEKKVKLSKLYYKVINPIFDEMINKSYKLKKHFEELKKIIDEKEIKIYGNIGKYFYYHFIAPKLLANNIKNIEIYQNSIVLLYSKIDRDFNLEDKIADLLNNEKENYYNMLDSIQYLRGGCITIQLSQGLSVKNIFDTYQNRNINKNKLIYSIKFNGNYGDEIKDINDYKQEIEESDLQYDNLLILEDKLIIMFKDSFQFSLFSKNQNLNLKLIPYKENILTNNEEIQENNYNMKIYIVKFEPKMKINNIHIIMKRYMRKINQKYSCKLNYYIDEKSSPDSIIVFYFINSEYPIKIPEKEIIGTECKNNYYKKNFSINWLSICSDFDFINKFIDFCKNNNLNVIPNKAKRKKNQEIGNYHQMWEYELINYSIENMKLIQNYIGFTTITLNSFAILELKSKSKDTFLQYNESIFQYSRNRYCNIEIIYYENKIKIYGRPDYRESLFEILSNYFKNLQNEKIIFSLKGKEDNLLLKTLLRKVNQKQIVILVSKNDQGEQQLEFRKKYYDFITDLLIQKKKSKTRNQLKSTRCEICLELFDNKYNNNYFKLKLCGHKFCVECLKMQICNSFRLTSANCIPVRCVKCKTIIANNDIFEIIIPNTPEYEFVMNKIIEIYMLKNSNELNYKSQNKFYWCPNKKENCNYIYNSQMKEMGETNMTCPNCSCKICLLCNGILDPNTPHNPNCHDKLYSKLSDKNRNWLLKNTKDCPMCHSAYEKNRGCNHMTCTICRPPTHFCYICGNILDNENPLKHFNDVNSKCNNRLWDDNTNNDVNNENENNENEEKDESDDDNDNENRINDYNNEIKEEEDSKIIEEEVQEENYSNNLSNNNNDFRRNNNKKKNNINEKSIFTQVMFERMNNNDSYSDNCNYYNSFKRKNNNNNKK